MELERTKGDPTPEKSDATKLKESLAEKYNISVTDLRQLETAIGQEAAEKEDAKGLNRWTYGNSVFFAFTIMTTIGECILFELEYNRISIIPDKS